MFDKLKSLLAGGPHAVITSAEQLTGGRASIRGLIGAAEPLKSPILHKPCAAFYYRSTYTTSSRIKGYIRQKLRDALVYADVLEITLEDGTVIRVQPPRHEHFSEIDHAALTDYGYQGFDAREQRIEIGAIVLAGGSLKEDSEGWMLKMTGLEQLSVPPAKRSPSSAKRAAPRPASRKKHGKKKRH